jgi:hypothetical protein
MGRRIRSRAALAGALSLLVAGVIGACDINPQPLPPGGFGPNGTSGGGQGDGSTLSNGSDGGAAEPSDSGGGDGSSPPVPHIDGSLEAGEDAADGGDGGELDAGEDAEPDSPVGD